jgi:hypothetical protein
MRHASADCLTIMGRESEKVAGISRYLCFNKNIIFQNVGFYVLYQGFISQMYRIVTSQRLQVILISLPSIGDHW